MKYLSAIKQVQPLLNFQGLLTTMDLPVFRARDKVVFVMGPTGTGKSRLAIDLATRFPAEIINSDKIQVHKGLNITTNKVTDDERRGVPHHMLCYIDPFSGFSPLDFQNDACQAVESVIARDRVPLIAGGSNSYLEALVDGCPEFRLRYECCFLWIDVAMPFLHSFVSERVDKMVKAGLVDEVREIFDPENAEYSTGIRRAIGVPELDQYLRAERDPAADEDTKARLLGEAIGEIKKSTCALACRQLRRIHILHRKWKREMHRIDVTEFFRLARDGDLDHEDVAWDVLVTKPSVKVVERFLRSKTQQVVLPSTVSSSSVSPPKAVETTPIPISR